MADASISTEEQVYEYKQTLGKIACCMCGDKITPNPSALCAKCLSAQVDVTAGISTNEDLMQCKNCQKWEMAKGSAGSKWQVADMESAELLSICLHRIKGLGRGSAANDGKTSAVKSSQQAKGKAKKSKNKTSDASAVTDSSGLSKPRVVEAKFIWTEPHSRRIKVMVIIERDIETSSGSDMAIRKPLEVEFVVSTQICPHCAKEDIGQTWRAVVQVRQNMVNHKRTFFFLEQLILQRNAAANALNIVIVPNGVDVYFSKQDHASKFADFVCSVVPARRKEIAKQLTSMDIRNNTISTRNALSVEIIPVCKYDLVVLPTMLHATLFGGGKSSLLLCYKIAGTAHLVDPATGNTAELRQAKYYSYPFRPIASYQSMSEFVIIDIGEHEVECARVSDFGTNDLRHKSPRKHFDAMKLSNLSPGDIVLGYDLEHSNLLHDEFRELLDPRKEIPSVILVHKPQDKSKSRSNRRKKHAASASGAGAASASAADAGEMTTPNEAYGISDEDVVEILHDLSEMGLPGEDIALLPSRAVMADKSQMPDAEADAEVSQSTKSSKKLIVETIEESTPGAEAAAATAASNAASIASKKAARKAQRAQKP